MKKLIAIFSGLFLLMACSSSSSDDDSSASGSIAMYKSYESNISKPSEHTLSLGFSFATPDDGSTKYLLYELESVSFSTQYETGEVVDTKANPIVFPLAFAQGKGVEATYTVYAISKNESTVTTTPKEANKEIVCQGQITLY